MHPCIIFQDVIKYNYKIQVNNYKICTLCFSYVLLLLHGKKAVSKAETALADFWSLFWS